MILPLLIHSLDMITLPAFQYQDKKCNTTTLQPSKTLCYVSQFCHHWVKISSLQCNYCSQSFHGLFCAIWCSTPTPITFIYSRYLNWLTVLRTEADHIDESLQAGPLQKCLCKGSERGCVAGDQEIKTVTYMKLSQHEIWIPSSLSQSNSYLAS